MNKKVYLKVAEYLNSHKGAKSVISVLNTILTYSVFFSYLLFLVYILIKKSDNLLVYILIPAISFVVLSIFRYFYNAPRPYEKWPEIKNECHTKTGMSFPSRHTFSAFIISYMFFDYSKLLGIVFLVVSVFIALFRVLLLKHFIKDVSSSAIFATLIYIVFINFC